MRVLPSRGRERARVPRKARACTKRTRYPFCGNDGYELNPVRVDDQVMDGEEVRREGDALRQNAEEDEVLEARRMKGAQSPSEPTHFEVQELWEHGHTTFRHCVSVHGLTRGARRRVGTTCQ